MKRKFIRSIIKGEARMIGAKPSKYLRYEWRKRKLKGGKA